ncbi:hypothetical protein BKA67DRAFT_588153 [Truncatella angustata]|uniref:Uncharacterized protein n=1 Tax=Truncatella angustata TaxID=152316 RepID=A0A9P8REG4_9PEZI|nr:uncharacterized protein BKA67DRAFT_588153 [Truncatella angustata]KAH6639963.1 hypothetical protein BKA67DRAFT_588153 [Truncatella angustata]
MAAFPPGKYSSPASARACWNILRRKLKLNSTAPIGNGNVEDDTAAPVPAPKKGGDRPVKHVKAPADANDDQGSDVAPPAKKRKALPEAAIK